MARMTRQAKAEARARAEVHKAEGQEHNRRGTCPRCGNQLRHNNSLAGAIWLQCLTPQSLTPSNGCGWQFIYDYD